MAQTLFRLPEFLEAPEIFAYCAIRKEVGTKEILQTARKLGKKVALPKITGTTMEFYYCQHFDELIPNRYGILEPTTTQLAVAETGLLLLPAVVADVHGYRIGYGGGYYDRYLAEHPEVFSIMLAFDMQIMEMLPRASFDVPARRVITETNGF
ncbi:MAG: 5-formyltetrahydrofolate cyclo-ligase [Candidatus Peribacteria bacterium]|nr:5-formyltetrahydrofolate cyclo-ligase [Candidatus Peribacteria bacterium]